MVEQKDGVKRPHSLRDWYAGVALAGCEVTAENEDGKAGFAFTPDQIAARCYAIADAMLRERAK